MLATEGLALGDRVVGGVERGGGLAILAGDLKLALHRRHQDRCPAHEHRDQHHDHEQREAARARTPIPTTTEQGGVSLCKADATRAPARGLTFSSTTYENFAGSPLKVADAPTVGHGPTPAPAPPARGRFARAPARRRRSRSRGAGAGSAARRRCRTAASAARATSRSGSASWRSTSTRNSPASTAGMRPIDSSAAACTRGVVVLAEDARRADRTRAGSAGRRSRRAPPRATSRASSRSAALTITKRALEVEEAQRAHRRRAGPRVRRARTAARAATAPRTTAARRALRDLRQRVRVELAGSPARLRRARRGGEQHDERAPADARSA